MTEQSSLALLQAGRRDAQSRASPTTEHTRWCHSPRNNPEMGTLPISCLTLEGNKPNFSKIKQKSVFMYPRDYVTLYRNCPLHCVLPSVHIEGAQEDAALGQ